MKWSKYSFSSCEISKGIYQAFINEVQSLLNIPTNATEILVLGSNSIVENNIYINEFENVIGLETLNRKWKDNLKSTGTDLPNDTSNLVFIAGNIEMYREIV